jgi:outer membrane protein assembly factor BamB
MQAIRRAALIAASTIVVGGGSAQAATVPGCASPAPGGDWPMYGGTVDNHRDQTAERTLTTANVSKLALAWKLAMPDAGVIQSTPVVADGCVFTGTSLGTVVAANADTGKLVWQTKLSDAGGISLAGAGIVGAPAVAGGLVYIGMTTTAASVEAALDQATGQIVWTKAIDTDNGGGIDSSPVPFDGMVFQGYQGDESHNHSNPGWVVLDGSREGGGNILVKGHTIPAEDYAKGDRGGSLIDTPAIDLERKLVFAGTGNPASPHQNPRTDALLKIDADPASSTFGQVLGFHRGTSDSYPAPTDVDSPVCQDTLQWPLGRFTCAQFDYNFLSSPNLYTDSKGRRLMTELQKSGRVTTIDTATMDEVWTATIAPPCFACNLGSSATDADGVYYPTIGGNLFSLNRDTGAVQWVAPLTGASHYNGVSVANGVVYNLDDRGLLEAFDAKTGAPLLAHPLIADTQTVTHDGGNSSGLSIARGSVFFSSQAGSGSTLFAFRLPASGASALGALK